MFLSLCFSIKTQAQNTISRTLSEELESLTGIDKERLEGFIYGTPALLILEDEPIYVWNKEKNIEVVDVRGIKVNLLSNTNYYNDFKFAKILILRLESGDVFQIDDEVLNNFKSLQYIVIKYNNELLLTDIQSKLNSLSLDNELENLVFLLDFNNGSDGEI